MLPKTSISFLTHTADIKFKVSAPSEEVLFETCVQALSRYMSRNASLEERKKKKLTLEGKDHYSLLYQLLDEILYLVDAEDLIVSRAKIRFTPKGLMAELAGDRAGEHTLTQVKAATYAEMKITKGKSNWSAQFVLDV